MKIGDVEKTVREALEINTSARDDDHMLYVEVAYIMKPELLEFDFRHVFLNYKHYGLPPLESVSRCRRKLQAKYEKLQSEEQVQKARAEKEIEMKNYARKEVK